MAPLITYLVSECAGGRSAIHLGAAVTAIEERRGRIAARCHDGAAARSGCGDPHGAAPLLHETSFLRRPASKAAASADIGFGNVVKILLRFTTRWWTDCAAAISPTCRFYFQMQRFRPGGLSIRQAIRS